MLISSPATVLHAAWLLVTCHAALASLSALRLSYGCSGLCAGISTTKRKIARLTVHKAKTTLGLDACLPVDDLAAEYRLQRWAGARQHKAAMRHAQPYTHVTVGSTRSRW